VSILVMMLWWRVFSNVCMPRAAFASLLLVTAGVLAAAAFLYKDGPIASAALLAPLLAWLSFACLLTFMAIP
jgi:tryptophan-rich sensory protein